MPSTAAKKSWCSRCLSVWGCVCVQSICERASLDVSMREVYLLRLAQHSRDVIGFKSEVNRTAAMWRAGEGWPSAKRSNNSRPVAALGVLLIKPSSNCSYDSRALIFTFLAGRTGLDNHKVSVSTLLVWITLQRRLFPLWWLGSSCAWSYLCSFPW